MLLSAFIASARFCFALTRGMRVALLGSAWVGILGASCRSDDNVGTQVQHLGFIESIEHPDLVGVNRLVVTTDNRFLYAASWRGDNLSIFSRNPQGNLTHVESLKNAILKGAIKLDLNHDESQLAVICMRSSTVLLFARDAENGKLQPDGFGTAEMKWPTSVSFSPGSKFLYVGDAGGLSSSQAQSSIVIFRVRKTGGLRYLSTVTHPDMISMRNVLLSPDGRNVYALCSSARCILVFERNDETGELNLLQRVKDGDRDKALLHGVHSAWFSAEGERLYTIAGRFEGTSGVTVFSRDGEGQITPMYNWQIEDGFAGGNDIQVTSDECTVIVSGTTGDSLAVLDNDLQRGTLKTRRLIPSSARVLLNGPSGLTFDAKREFLHVAVENGSALTTFALKVELPQ